MSVIIPTNKFQTPVTTEWLESFPSEVQEQFLDFIDTVPMLKWMISENRPRAKDLPRDQKGRIIVDITHPHILEDMDYFRPAAKFYEENGCYSLLKPNSNPNSEYGKWFAEEVRRCRDGYVREADGEWITGQMYWYMNYCQIMLNRKSETSGVYLRVEDFPDFWEGIYYRFHYIEQARMLGKHGMELARRGAHPYYQKVYTPDGIKSWGEIKVGDRLFGTYGNITTVTDIPFDDEADVYRLTLRDGRTVYASDDHIWNVIRRSDKVSQRNTKYLYEHYKLKREPNYRIPSGEECQYYIPKNEGVEFTTTTTPIDPYTLGMLIGDGCFRVPKYKNQVTFTSSPEDIDNYISECPYPIIKYGSDSCTYSVKLDISYLYECDLWMKKSEDKFVPDIYKYNDKKTRLRLLQGLFDTDGFVHGNVPVLSTTSVALKDDVMEIARSLGYMSFCTKQQAGYKKDGVYRQCLDVYEISVYAGSEIFTLERKKNRIDDNKTESRGTKCCITNIEYVGKQRCKCVTVDAVDESYLIGDFIQTHNCSKSFSLASMMSHNLILGENSENKRRVTTILTAYTKEYLAAKDGTLTKFTPMVDFCAEHTEFPRLMLKRSTSEMIWQMGYRNTNGNAKGSLNSVMAVSVKDDEGKIRGKRGFVFFEEMGNYPRFLGVWDNVRDSVKEGSHVFAQLYAVGCVCAGTKVWLPDGRSINIEDLKQEDGIFGFDGRRSVPEEIELLTIPKLKECVEIELENGTTLRCSVDHPIYTQKKIQYRPYLGNYKLGKHEMHFEYSFIPAGQLTTKHRVCEARRIPAFGNEKLFDARLVGMLIGDGSYGFNNTPKYSSEDSELLEYVESRYETGLSASHVTKKGNLYKDIRVKGICKNLREIGIYGQTKLSKRLPSNYQQLDKENTALMLAGLYDTDGTFCVSHQSIELCQSNKEILEQIAILLRKFGIFGHIVKYEPRLGRGRKDKNPYYRLCIRGRVNVSYFAENIPIICKHKVSTLREIIDYFANNPSKKPAQYDTKELEVSRVKSVKNIGEQLVYNMTVSGSHTYIANNIITHNTAGDKESDFSSIKTVLYNPDAYEVYALENVYDQKGKGTQKFAYFFPSYISRAGCMDKNGNSDVTAALMEILMERYMVKQGGDPASLLSRIAQMPITPAEAILKVKSNFFPVVMLNERLRQLDMDPRVYDDVYVGTLVDVGGRVEFRATDDTPIRKWPVDNTEQGALEIYAMPPSGNIPNHRFIIGLDPVDNDQAESSSLSSTFVFDLFTDEIVAEYTGRRPFAEDNYEMARLLAVFYNASVMYEANRKGAYAYFAKKHATWMLADCPEYLRDRQLVKYSLFGSAQKGISVNAPLIAYSNDLIRDWLNKTYPVEVKDEKGEIHIQQVPQLYKLRNRALIQELIAYSPEVNVDRVRALAQVMLYREHFIILYGGSPEADGVDSSDASDDDFFDKDWRRHLDKLGPQYKSTFDL